MHKKQNIKNNFILFGILALFSHKSYAIDLSQAYDLAEKNSSELMIATHEYEANKRNIAKSFAPLMPRVNASYSRDLYKDNTVNTDKNHKLSINASQSIIDFNSLTNYYNAWEAHKADELAFEYAKQKLALDVADKYFAILDAISDLDLQESKLKAFTEKLEQTKHRFNLGMVPIADVHAAQASHDSAVVENLASNDNLANKFEDLKQIIGHIDEHKLSRLKSDKSFTQINGSENDWSKEALQRNLSVKTKKILKEVADNSLSAKKSDFLPKLSLVGSIQSEDLSSNNFTKLFDNTAKTVGLTLSWDLLSGGMTLAESRQLSSLYQKTCRELDLEFKKVDNATRQAYRGVSTTLKQIKAFEQAVVSAKAALSAVEASYEVGTATIYEVLTAENTYLEMKNKAEKARHAFIILKLKLEMLVGKLSKDSLKGVNNWLE